MPSEFEFIDKLRRKFGKPDKRITLGIGDDAAIISGSSRKEMVVTADMLVEDVDFKLDWSSPRELGHKALAVSLSDIAAMGAKPVWSTVSIGLPKAIWESDFAQVFYESWSELAAKHNVKLVGGDISQTPDKVVIDSVVGGEIRRGRAIRRSGAKTGDLIYVTGSLGGAAGGLKILKDGLDRTGAANELIGRQRAPIPQCSVGALMSELRIPTAMIDISDGLSSDLMHICEESGVGARIYEENLPVDKNLSTFGFSDELDLVLNGGEDFELLFTVPKNLARDKQNKLAKLDVTLIGEITEDIGNIEFHGKSGVEFLEPRGFTHF